MLPIGSVVRFHVGLSLKKKPGTSVRASVLCVLYGLNALGDTGFQPYFASREFTGADQIPKKV